MLYRTKITIVVSLLGLLVACSSNKEDYALSDTEAKANRNYTNQQQQKDRDRDHIERMRRADAINRANRNIKGNRVNTTVIVPR